MAKNKSKVLIVGLGDGSINAVDRMISNNVTDSEYLVIGSSLDHLKGSKVKNQIHIGTSSKDGCSADPLLGKKLMEDNKSKLIKFLKEADIVFLICAMGGGTGTGATPVVAKICKDLGIITVAIVSTPFAFEGHRRTEIAQTGVDALTKVVDSMVIIPNENILKIIDKKTRLNDAFAFVDNIFSDITGNLAGFVTVEGDHGFDSKDIKEILKDGGKISVAIGYSRGENLSPSSAIEAAVSSSSFVENIAQAENILISFSGNKEIEMDDMEEAVQALHDQMFQTKNMFLGFRQDKSMKDIISAMIFVFTEPKKGVSAPLRWDNLD